MDWQRRRLLQLAGISGIGVLAGCNDSGNSDTESPSQTDGFTPGSNTPQFSQVKLAASDGKVGDQFGSSVAISGDTALIGADSPPSGSLVDEYPNREWTGSAYVFVYSDSTWTQRAKLAPNDDRGQDFIEYI